MISRMMSVGFDGRGARDDGFCVTDLHRQEYCV
jgi:hypothetical protein